MYFHTVSVAVGQQYELEVQRLLKTYPETFLITERTPGIETRYDVPLLNGIATKCMHVTLLPDTIQGPVIFCDADLVPMMPDPLQYFMVKEDTDIAMVPYPGRWHTPDPVLTKAMAVYGKLNSGIIYFKNIQVAKDICSKWHQKYIERMDDYIHGRIKTSRTGEFDEPSLILVLTNTDYKFEPLDPRWNVWGDERTLNINCSHKVDNPYFQQKHMGWSPYDSYPTIS